MTANKKAVFILLGQSNAVGHGVPMDEADKIVTPLTNVYGLHRKDNQRLHPTALTWRGYTSDGMNLGEEQDHTYSLANCLAAAWQQRIDGGEALPDLYIVQIAIGAQGVTKEYMWYPYREEKMVPGTLETADISLFPFTVRILSLLKDSLGTFDILGLHWRGGENDVTADTSYLQTELHEIYSRIFREFSSILNDPPIVLHKLCCPDRMNDMDPTGGHLANMHLINRVFAELADSHSNISLFDVNNAPFYENEGREKGIFLPDAVHYTAQTNRWVAESITEQYIKRLTIK